MPTTIEAEIIAKLTAALPALDGIISAGIRPEGETRRPWVTYEATVSRSPSSRTTSALLTMELTVIASTYGEARELAESIADRVPGNTLDSGEVMTLGDSQTSTDAIDDGAGDGERSCTLEILAWYHTDN